MLSQARDAVARSHRLQDLRARYHERVQKTRASAMLLRLIDALFAGPALTVSGARDILEVSFPDFFRPGDLAGNSRPAGTNSGSGAEC